MIDPNSSHKTLLISLAINLLLIGAIAGEWVSGARRPPPPMQWAANDLDEATRARVRQILEEQRPAAQRRFRPPERTDLRNMSRCGAAPCRGEGINDKSPAPALHDQQEKLYIIKM